MVKYIKLKKPWNPLLRKDGSYRRMKRTYRRAVSRVGKQV